MAPLRHWLRSLRGRRDAEPREPQVAETLWPPPPAAAPPARPADEAQSAITYLLVCRGAACRSAGADDIWTQCLDAFVTVRSRGDMAAATPIEVACLRLCPQAPVFRFVQATEFRPGELAGTLADKSAFCAARIEPTDP